MVSNELYEVLEVLGFNQNRMISIERPLEGRAKAT